MGNGGGYLIAVYLAYGTAAIGLTIWLATTLFRNGTVFLHDVFEDRPALGEAVNRLLVVGFYMLNLGYAFLLLQDEVAPDAVSAVEVLVHKLGLLLVSLGVIHFVNFLVFWKIRNRAQLASAPPIAPTTYWPTPGAPAQQWNQPS